MQPTPRNTWLAALAAIVLVALAPAAARAAVLYDFTYTEAPGGFPGGSGIGPISGTFTVDDSVSPNRIVGITGTTLQGAITGLVAPSGTPGAPDNLFFPAGPFLSSNGVAFTVGPDVITLAFDALRGTHVALRPALASISDGTLSVTAVPAPAAFGLFVLGLASLGLARRRG